LKEGLWVQDISPNKSVSGVFLAKERKVLQGKTGKPYLLLRLTDRSGEIEGRVWDRVEELGNRFQAGDLIRVTGEAVSYQGTVQVKIRDIRPAFPLTEENMADYVPHYAQAMDESQRRLQELMDLARGIVDEPLRALVLDFLEDPALKMGWLTAPAAKKLHHARFGGLLEHTLSLYRLADMLCGHYSTLRRDMLLAGVVLHDVGKIRELHAPWRPEYTTEGRLLGHVAMGVEMLMEKLPGHPSVSSEQAMELKHMILSHHGHMEYGSPRRPKTVEALVLYMLDDLDAKFDAFHEHLVSDNSGDDQWTSYHSLFDRYLYRGQMEPQGHKDERWSG
jgi:3'-5' exoribonuclease